MAVAISLIMVLAGFARVTLFHGSYQDAIAIAASLLAIVFISIVVGASLPLLLHQLRLLTRWRSAGGCPAGGRPHSRSAQRRVEASVEAARAGWLLALTGDPLHLRLSLRCFCLLPRRRLL